MTDQPYVPTTDLIYTTYLQHMTRHGDVSVKEVKADFDRWYDAEIREAEQRGAQKALREVADGIAETAHFMIDGDKYTPCSSCKSIHYQYLDYCADQMEG